MTVSLKHTFVSAIADAGDATLVQPSNWNAEHTLSMATNRILGRTTAGTGSFEEITVGAGLSLSGGSLTSTTMGTVTSVTGTAPVVSSGGTTPAISMPVATGSVSGYLSSTDWTTFNGKGSGTVTNVTGTAPVVSSGGATPAISMAAATGSVNGYLTSTDWTTFNGKGSGTVTSVAALTLGTTGTDLTSSVVNGTTTPVITLNVPTASASNRGALSSTDWSTFNGKQALLVSATNIKTINGSSILGAGDLTVTAAGAVPNGTQTGTNAEAIGLGSIANGNDATAAGYGANATGASATAIGDGSIANGSSASAFGQGANATGASALALGAATVANGAQAIAVGRYSTIANGSDAGAFGYGASAQGASALAVGNAAIANGGEATAIGVNSTAIGTQAQAIGKGTVANGTHATALGNGANATGDHTTAVGSNAKANADSSSAFGDSSVAAYANSTAVGVGATTGAINEIAIGRSTETMKVYGPANIVGKTTPRMNSQASASTLTPNADTYDNYAFTALAAACTINADAGTPLDGQPIMLRFLDNGTARALTWTTGSSKAFRAIGITLPTTTTVSKTLYVGGRYNAAAARWDMLATGVEA
jgi:hypothetical protein